ncbi:MAG: zinc ribbon domain-containing protein [Promethearchaeota archaeon]|nr:MAG: zinc ribbon domain-containing protein [Candidatus Lokiarchaeota archaeon]
MDFRIIIACALILLVIVKSIIYIIYLANKSTKENKKSMQKSNFVFCLNERVAERISNYPINARSNSNVIALQEPYYLKYNLEKSNDNYLKEDFIVRDLKDCRYCGNLNDEEARYCTYCGSKLKS